VQHLKAATPVTHPTLGVQQVLAPAIRLSRTPAAVVSATPERGQHTDEVLSELGVSAEDLAQLRQKGVVL
jgi:formyl-CoA transferase